MAGCSSFDRDVPEAYAPKDIPVTLSLSLGGGSPSVKADMSQITELKASPVFRGISSVRAIPFGTEGLVQLGNNSLGGYRLLPGITSASDTQASADGKTYHQGLIKENHAHLYSGSNVALPTGTASLLLYGTAVRAAAPSGPKDKHLSGSLLESGWVADASMAAGALTFSPDPILSQQSLKDSVTTVSKGIAQALNEIVTACCQQDYYYIKGDQYIPGTTYVPWDANLGSVILKNCFEDFTNDGQSMTGAGSNVAQLITSLYKQLLVYNSQDDTPYLYTEGGIDYPTYEEDNNSRPITYGMLYNALKDSLLIRINGLVADKVLTEEAGNKLVFTSEGYQDFPQGLGLPAGSAVVRYSSATGFTPVTEGLDGIAPIGQFCYMPSLYYFVNSRISAVSNKEIYKEYTSSNTTWNAILSKYSVGGKKVDAQTTSVAVDKPLQFAPGLLVLTVRAYSEHLSDNDGDDYTYCSPKGTAFPVTGVIVSSQFTQQFDFTPKTPLSTEYYLYDNLTPGMYLTVSQSEQLRTLVLPTPVNRDIYFFLEMRNDSGSAFYGAEGIIHPGAYFYLAGQITCPSATERVFSSDTYVTVDCVVKTLENAHVCVPEMGDPQLVVGVDANVNWINSVASYVILDN